MYRDVLTTIHSAFDAIPIKSSVLLQLHRDLYKFSSAKGGNYKNTNNVIDQKTNPPKPSVTLSFGGFFYLGGQNF